MSKSEPTSVSIEIDVTDSAAVGVKCKTVATVTLPDPAKLGTPPVVAFALPGARYSRKYFTIDLLNEIEGGQAAWHAERGWVFVAIDSVGVGDAPFTKTAGISLLPMIAANHASVQTILAKLADGKIASRYPAIREPVTLGLGQSMGGGLTILQQAHHDSYDGIASLGFSAVWTSARGVPGTSRSGTPYLARDSMPSSSEAMPDNPAAMPSANNMLRRLQSNLDYYPNKTPTPPAWGDFYDDVPSSVRSRELSADLPPPAWRSTTMPSAVFWLISPGSVGPEASAIVVPVLSAFGERDVTEDPRLEHKAYRHAVDFSSFVCPRMGHMHNFASTREILWSRIHHWGTHVATLKQLLPNRWPSGLFSDSY